MMHVGCRDWPREVAKHKVVQITPPRARGQPPARELERGIVQYEYELTEKLAARRPSPPATAEPVLRTYGSPRPPLRRPKTTHLASR